MPETSEQKKRRKTIYMDEPMLRHIQELAGKNGLSDSSAVNLLISMALNNHKAESGGKYQPRIDTSHQYRIIAWLMPETIEALEHLKMEFDQPNFTRIANVLLQEGLSQFLGRRTAA